jgi:hypothetical protein
MMDVDVLQGALRLLFLLDRAGAVPLPEGRPAKAGAVAVIESETKLQKLHFWMRNPDYLSLEILTLLEDGKGKGLSVEIAAVLLEGGEPELRLYPMLRHLYGAFEPLDDSMSHLVSVGLALCRTTRDPTGAKPRHDYWLLPEGRKTAERILVEHPGLQWYGDRADLIAVVAGNASGNQLRDRHYVVPEYADTQMGRPIPPVADLARERLARMGGTVS